MSDTASTRTPDTVEDERYIIVMDVDTNGFIKTSMHSQHQIIYYNSHTSYNLVWDSIQKVEVVKKSRTTISNLMGG